ncbi:MAG: hypothetical protein ACUVXF_09335 [Desulfobaccales bacterium]
MDDMDKALEALKIQIKKEIIDNYFGERRYLEEETQALNDEVAAYQKNHSRLCPIFSALYAALSREAAIDRLMKLLSLADRPFYEDFLKLPPAARQGLLTGYHGWGLTARGRHLHLVQDIYQDLLATCASLKEQYGKLMIHLRLLNEDIQKFNQSFDFGLIAAQIEAMEGGAEPIGGGLLSSEREELSTRMRFKTIKLTPEDIPPPPELPPWNAIKGEVKTILAGWGS